MMFGKETKTETEKLIKISIYDVSKPGWLDRPGVGILRWCNDLFGSEWIVHVRGIIKGHETFCELRYTITDVILGSSKYTTTIQVGATPCKFGGYQRWFLCPIQKDGVTCGRRVVLLYLHDAAFGCRHCHNLVYASQNRNHRRPENTIQQNLKDLLAMDKLSKEIKRHEYKGKTTKKYQKYKELLERYLARMHFTVDQ